MVEEVVMDSYEEVPLVPKLTKVKASSSDIKETSKVESKEADVEETKYA